VSTIDRKVPGVRLLSLLGEGGMGIVYRGVRLRDALPVAVKFIREAEASEQEFTARFEREARILDALDHEHILKLYDWGLLEDGTYYIVMEFVDGCSLTDLLDVKGKLTPSQVLRVGRAASKALASAWEGKVIHRDIKPDNILVGTNGQVKLVDFGLAKDTSENRKFTLTGQVIGTPAFMSPEQGQGDAVDHRSDIYSLGVTLFTMLAGRRPFDGGTPLEVVVQHINTPPPDLAECAPGLPRDLVDLIGRMMAKTPEDRPAEIAAVADEMERILASLEDDGAPSIPALVAQVCEALVEERDTRVGGPPPTPPAAEEATPPTRTPTGREGEVIAGKYEVKSKLGKGGMGSVFRVRHLTLEEDFALKVLNPFLASDESFRQRFMREAKAASAFVHKHAVQIREFGEDGGLLYMTMDYCPGRTLQSVLDEAGAVSEQRAASIAHQMLSALKEAHAAGLVHRDLKPSNVMIENEGGRDVVRILDFGVAKLTAPGGQDTEGRPLTGPGAVMGTVEYMSPEQAMGREIDGRSDLFSLAVILYEAVSGNLPFEGDNPQQRMFNLATQPPLPLSRHVKGVSRKFERLLMRNLAKDPAGRCASAEECLAELETLSADLKSTVAIRRKGLPAWLQAASAAILLVAGAIVALAVWNPFSSRAPAPPPGLTPEQRRAQRDQEEAAFRDALAKKDHRRALDRVYAILDLASTPQAKMQWEETKRELENTLARAEETFREAQREDEAGNPLKALPRYEAYLEAFPPGKRAETSRSRRDALKTRIAAPGALAVFTEPAGAKVYVDGELADTTPCLLEDLAAGRRRITLDLEGYHPVRKTLSWTADGNGEIRTTLRRGEFGAITVVSGEGDRKFLVKHLGQTETTSHTFQKVEVGDYTLEITDMDSGTAYLLPVTVRRDRETLVTVEFSKWVSDELDAWRERARGTSAEETLRIHRAFLEAYPKGEKAAACRQILETLRAEEEAFRRCQEARTAARRLEACAAYRIAYADAVYPFGWHLDEVRAIESRILAAQEEEAFKRIGRRSGYEGVLGACRDYLESWPDGAHAAAVRARLHSLQAEKTRYDDFRNASVFWQKMSFGKQYLDRFPEGFWADEVRSEREARLAEEAQAAGAILGNPDVEAVVRAWPEYRDAYKGGPHADEVQEAFRRAEEERRVFRNASESIARCNAYLSRYPGGWYREAVEEMIRTFGWPAEDTGGVGFEGKLPPGIKRAERIGEYESAVDGAIMVYVPKGFFPMGTDDWREKSVERPQFLVWIGGFFIDKYEVTNRQYRAFLDWAKTAEDPHRFAHEDEPEGKDYTPALWDETKWNGDALPVVGVDWFDAYAYAGWAGKRLPTEAQWEKAASADPLRRVKVRFPWGDERPTPGIANFDREEDGSTVPVLSLPAGRSPIGCFHMAGNVSEWCLDAFVEDYHERFIEQDAEGAGWVANPFVPGPGNDHTIRGGDWAGPERHLLTTRRRPFGARGPRVGFRCAVWHNPAAQAEGD